MVGQQPFPPKDGLASGEEAVYLKGDYSFTKGHRPWEIIYQENLETRSAAMQREKFLKSGQGRKWLDQNKIK